MNKRQKVMLVVLAVCVLGMGGVWFAFRDTGSSQRGSSDAPVAEVKKRETKSSKPKITKRARSRRKKRDAEPTLQRRQRDSSERQVLDKKKRKRGRKAKEKKKKIVPAA